MSLTSHKWTEFATLSELSLKICWESDFFSSYYFSFSSFFILLSKCLILKIESCIQSFKMSLIIALESWTWSHCSRRKKHTKLLSAKSQSQHSQLIQKSAQRCSIKIDWLLIMQLHEQSLRQFHQQTQQWWFFKMKNQLLSSSELQLHNFLQSFWY